MNTLVNVTTPVSLRLAYRHLKPICNFIFYYTLKKVRVQNLSIRSVYLIDEKYRFHNLWNESL